MVKREFLVARKIEREKKVLVKFYFTPAHETKCTDKFL